jgi:hypothetical protein
MLRYAMLRYDMLCYATLCYATLRYVMLTALSSTGQVLASFYMYAAFLRLTSMFSFEINKMAVTGKRLTKQGCYRLLQNTLGFVGRDPVYEQAHCETWFADSLRVLPLSAICGRNVQLEDKFYVQRQFCEIASELAVLAMHPCEELFQRVRFAVNNAIERAGPQPEGPHSHINNISPRTLLASVGAYINSAHLLYDAGLAGPHFDAVDDLPRLRYVRRYDTLRHATARHATSRYAIVPYRAIPYRAVPYRTVPVPYRTVPYRTVMLLASFTDPNHCVPDSDHIETIYQQLLEHSSRERSPLEVDRKPTGMHQAFGSVRCDEILLLRDVHKALLENQYLRNVVLGTALPRAPTAAELNKANKELKMERKDRPSVLRGHDPELVARLYVDVKANLRYATREYMAVGKNNTQARRRIHETVPRDKAPAGMWDPSNIQHPSEQEVHRR